MRWIRRTFTILNIKRFFKHNYQKLRYGFSDDETWSLDCTIAKFVLPRLKRFKELNNGFPFGMTFEQFDEALDKMIFFFEYAVKRDETDIDWYKENKDKVQEGKQLFCDCFFDLWW